MPQQIDPTLTEIFGEPISVYTQAQAIEDGCLMEVPTEDSGPFYKVPVILTNRVFGACEEEARMGGDVAAVIRVVLAHSLRDYKILSDQRREFRPMLANEARHYFAEIGPNDEGAPCIVIGEPIDF